MNFSLSELLLIGIIALIILGPQKILPMARTAGLWFARFKRFSNQWKQIIAHELAIDNLQQDINQRQQKLEDRFYQVEQGIHNWQQRLWELPNSVENPPIYDRISSPEEAQQNHQNSPIYQLPRMTIAFSALKPSAVIRVGKHDQLTDKV